MACVARCLEMCPGGGSAAGGLKCGPGVGKER